MAVEIAANPEWSGVRFELQQECLELIYEEHVGIPTNCFGESSYFVQDVQLLDKPQIEMIQKGEPQ